MRVFIASWDRCCCSWAGTTRALAQYTLAAGLDTRNPEFIFNRAAMQRYFGDIDGAEQGFDAVIKLRPSEYEAYNARAQLRTQTAERNHVAQLRDVIARTRDPAGLTQLHYALAKELEDLGDFDQAFDKSRTRRDDQAQAHAIQHRD